MALTSLAASLILTATALGPPSGRPPGGPLAREAPRATDVRFEVTLSTMIPFGPDDPRVPRDPRTNDPRQLEFGGVFRLADTPIVMPIIYNGTYNRTVIASVRPDLWLAHGLDGALPSRFRIDEGLPHHTHLAVLPIESFTGQHIRWSLSYRAQTWSSRIDDVAAARVPWPRSWPDDVADGLQPQLFIESGDPIFAQTVERVSAGQLRLVPPYLAAKDLVRYCVNELQVSGSAVQRGRNGVLHGMRVVGALAAAKAGRGGPNDLVCVCVAVLRAAGIPARPVIGVEEDERKRETFVVWAEFYLPDAGWVPFDPIEMRGKAIQNRDVRAAWPEFGTLKDLNRRIPLAYHFLPPRAVESPMSPAVWGWDPRPSGAPNAEQIVRIQLTSRGPVQPGQQE